MIMTALAIIGFCYRPAGRPFRTVSWISLALSTLYVLDALVILPYAQ